MKITNPHDKYFKEIFSRKEETAALLKGMLPVELKKNIDFDALKPLKDTYVDEELKESFSDLVYVTKYRGKTEIMITLLFEHKSRPVDYPHLQLLRYLLRLWEAGIKQKKGLTPVIPIIFYHGKEPWKEQRFEDYFEGIDNTLQPFIPSFDYLLNDLSRYSDEEITGRYTDIITRTALLIFKNIFDEASLQKKFPYIFYHTREIENSETGEKFFVATFTYLFNFVEKIDINTVTETIKTITEKGGDIAMTIAAQLERKGRKEGLEKGILKARRESVINFYKKSGYSADLIADYLGLDKKFVEKILKDAKLI